MLLFNDTVFCYACIVLMLVADDGISDKIGPIVQLVSMTVNIGVHMVESVRVRVQCECRVQHVELCGVSVRRVLRPSRSTERRGS